MQTNQVFLLRFNQSVDPLCIRAVRGSKLVSPLDGLAQSAAHSCFLASLSSSGSISARRMPFSLHTWESLQRRHISSLTCLRTNKTTMCLFLMSSFRPTLCTMSIAYSSCRSSISGAILFKSCMTFRSDVLILFFRQAFNFQTPSHLISLLLPDSFFKLFVFFAQTFVALF